MNLQNVDINKYLDDVDLRKLNQVIPLKILNERLYAHGRSSIKYYKAIKDLNTVEYVNGKCITKEKNPELYKEISLIAGALITELSKSYGNLPSEIEKRIIKYAQEYYNERNTITACKQEWFKNKSKLLERHGTAVEKASQYIPPTYFPLLYEELSNSKNYGIPPQFDSVSVWIDNILSSQGRFKNLVVILSMIAESMDYFIDDFDAFSKGVYAILESDKENFVLLIQSDRRHDKKNQVKREQIRLENENLQIVDSLIKFILNSKDGSLSNYIKDSYFSKREKIKNIEHQLLVSMMKRIPKLQENYENDKRKTLLRLRKLVEAYIYAMYDKNKINFNILIKEISEWYHLFGNLIEKNLTDIYINDKDVREYIDTGQFKYRNLTEKERSKMISIIFNYYKENQALHDKSKNSGESELLLELDIVLIKLALYINPRKEVNYFLEKHWENFEQLMEKDIERLIDYIDDGFEEKINGRTFFEILSPTFNLGWYLAPDQLLHYFPLRRFGCWTMLIAYKLRQLDANR